MDHFAVSSLPEDAFFKLFSSFSWYLRLFSKRLASRSRFLRFFIIERLQLTSGSADTLRLAVNIFYDPLVLTASGARLDGTAATPVQDAVNAFLDNLPFNGLFVLNNLIAALQAIDGVVIGQVVSAQASYASLPFTLITVEYTPDAGYMTLDSIYFTTNVTYTAHNPV